MKNFLEHFNGAFKSQDSKYYLRTAFKITVIPVISFAITIYSLWIFIEMNHAFFVSNGFSAGAMFKEALVDRLFLNLADYGLYLFGFLSSVFLMGLGLSYFILRPFNHIADHVFEAIDEPDLEFEVDKLNRSNLLYQASSVLLDYIWWIFEKKDLTKFKIPKEWEKIKTPPINKIFYLHYASAIAVIAGITSIALYAFTVGLHQEIIQGAIEILEFDKAIGMFLIAQQDSLKLIYTICIGLTCVMYVFMARNIISEVEGTGYAFFRDIKKMVSGDHEKRLFPRFNDPGKKAADALNFFFNEALEDAGMNDNVTELSFTSKSESETPPAFVDQQVVGGDTCYNLITPTGHKVENMGTGDLIKILKELELKK